MQPTISNSPRNIQEWKAFSAEDPQQSARLYWERLDNIPEPIKARVFSHIQTPADLEKAFVYSVSDPSLPLSGVPFLLKDLFDFPNTQTTASSLFLERVRPGPHEESAISKAARSQGAVFGGKTHLNEFAYGLSGENLHYGDCPHPFRQEALSGGSSSGSAWAVASGIAPIAFGTDTGGSIRVPAAWCGLYGIRLTPNNWSKEGCFPLAPSFDTAGWFCETAEDMADAIRALLSPQSYSTESPKGLNLFDYSKLESSVFRDHFLNTLETIGAKRNAAFSEAFADATRICTRHFSVLQSTEALQVHRAWLDKRKTQYDPAVWQRIARARKWVEEDVEAAFAAQTKVKAFFAKAFEQYDYITLPASWTAAISSAEHTDEYRSLLLDLTSPGSLSQLPIFTIPIHLETGESTGLQIIYQDEKSDLPLRVLRNLRSANMSI